MCLLKIFHSKNKIKLFASLFFSYFFVISCVGPAEYNDGLLENLPAIINEKDYFSLSLFSKDFNDSLVWNLNMDIVETDILLTTLIIKDLDITPSDSSSLILSSLSGDTIMNANIFADVLFTSTDSISVIGIPNIIRFNSDNFTGRLEYQLIKISGI